MQRNTIKNAFFSILALLFIGTFTFSDPDPVSAYAKNSDVATWTQAENRQQNIDEEDEEDDQLDSPIITSRNAPKTPARKFPQHKGGQWSNVIDWPFIPIHMVLDVNGEVVSYGGTSQGEQGGHLFYDVWDPRKGTGANSHDTKPNRTSTDTFCSAQGIIASTGEILTVGGSNRPKDKGDFNNDGNSNFTFYNPASSNFVNRGTTMAQPRWYSTLITLPDGQVLIEGGVDSGKTKVPVIIPERYNPETQRVSQLVGAKSDNFYSSNERRWYYPRSFVAPNGMVFGITGTAMYYLDPYGNGSIKSAGSFSGRNHGVTSTAVMYEPGKILQVGGGGYSANNNDGKLTAHRRATNRASIIDITSGKPQVSRTSNMQYRRSWANATVLPTGEVFVNGGSRVVNENKGVARSPEIWDPKTGKWTRMNSEALPRLYHSAALLLPDGRVLVGGGGSPGPARNLNAQIFSPPYLFNNNGTLSGRPQIVRAPSKITHQGIFKVTAGDAAANREKSIRRVTLVRHGAVTHSFNSSQRFIELDFKQNGKELTITGPDNANIAPPGYYMLFIFNDKGVPSIAKTVWIAPK